MSLREFLESLFPDAPAALERLQPGRHAVVRGRVAPRDLIDSPLTGEPCVYYRYLVEEWRPVSLTMLGGEGQWLVAERDEAAAEFYLDDGSARVLVSPVEADVTHAAGLGPDRLEVGVRRRASEWRIVPGDEVEIRGLADSVSDPLDEGRGYREGPARACMRGTPGRRIRIKVLSRPTSNESE